MHTKLALALIKQAAGPTGAHNMNGQSRRHLQSICQAGFAFETFFKRKRMDEWKRKEWKFNDFD